MTTALVGTPGSHQRRQPYKPQPHHPNPQSASFGSIQPASLTADQNPRATNIDPPTLPPMLLPVT